jgi:hypothetical protein
LVQKGAESLIKREEGGSLSLLKHCAAGAYNERALSSARALCRERDDDMVVIIGKFKARKKRTKRLSELVIKAHIT